MAMAIVLFVVGFGLLIKGADCLITGSSALARRMNISEMVVGLSVVAFGTSLPELVVNLFASFRGNSDIAIGNVFGSNVANVLLILGVAALIRPLFIQKATIFSEIPFSLTATLLVGFLANASVFDQSRQLIISRIDGVILMVFFLLFLAYIVNLSKEKPFQSEENSKLALSTMKIALNIVIGLVGLFLGGKWVVDGAVEIALHIGLSQSFIGLTVVAIGTSLPELVTSVMASLKKNFDIAIGNVIGSNIFNLLWILGVSAIIKPLPFLVVNNLDIMVMVFSSTLIIAAVAIGRKNHLNRFSGAMFLVLYVGYLVYLIMRG
jgi:cation:H+ antiporter